MIRDEDEELAVFHKDITYLNALLSKQSLQPRPMRHYLESYPNLPTAVKMEVAGLVDLAFSLLSTQQKDSNFRKDYEERIQRASEETRKVQQENDRLSKLAMQRESEVGTLSQRLREANERIANLEGTQQALRDDLARSRSSYAMKEKQFAHELCKRDREYDRLRDQLSRGGINNTVRLADSNDADDGSNKVEQVPIHLKIPPSHPSSSTETSRTAELENENGNLRNLVASISLALRQIRGTDESTTTSTSTAASRLSMNLPAEWIYDQVREELEASLADISQRLCQNGEHEEF